MGNNCGGSSQGGRTHTPRFKPIPDQYESLEQVQDALRGAGLESSELIIAIDTTGSNVKSGLKTYGAPLHSLDHNYPNPYQHVISVIANTLAEFDDDHEIPVYGFGDKRTTEKSVFSFLPDDAPCPGLESVLSVYNQLIEHVELSGPTSFAPAIRQAIEIVNENDNRFHVLLIIADGQVSGGSAMKATVDAIVEASHYPLAIVCIGVGDGPWSTMEHFDDKLPSRKFDNFQFVDFHSVMKLYKRDPEPAFAMTALMELPDQYRLASQLGLLGQRSNNYNKGFALQPPPFVVTLDSPREKGGGRGRGGGGGGTSSSVDESSATASSSVSSSAEDSEEYSLSS